MNILFTANRFPYPPYRGDKLKIFHLATQLAKRHNLHLVTFLQQKSDVRYLPELEKIFSKIHLVPLGKYQSYLNSLAAVFKNNPFQVEYFRSAAMSEKITELRNTYSYDAVHVQHLRMAQYWADDATIPRILDLPDAYSLYWKRRVETSSGWRRIFNRVEQKRIYNYESVLSKYDMSLVCSKEDLFYLHNEKGITNIQLLPNGVDVSVFSGEHHDYGIDDTILFTGNMDYAPNVDAVQYFAKDIFPEIKKALPGLTFVIAGQRPVKKIRSLACDDIRVTGFVPNLADMYRTAAIVVAPLRFGAGTQNKVLEAMAMGVPVVSHHIGFDGLDISSGEGVFLAGDKGSFIRHCINLLQSRALREQAGQAGKTVITENYSWQRIAGRLEQYFMEIQK